MQTTVPAPPPARSDLRLALASLVLSLIPFCLTQFVAFWLASRILRRMPKEDSPGEARGLAIAAQTCAVFMVPVTGIVVVAAMALVIPWNQRRQLEMQELSVVEAMRLIRDAQAQWRQRDPEGDGRHEYCTESVRALYETPDKEGRPLALIPREIASADAGAPNRGGVRPYRGYYFRVLARDPDGVPYPDRAAHAYGVVAWPDSPRVFGGRMYVVNELGVVWGKEFTAGAEVKEWPARDPATKGWRPIR